MKHSLDMEALALFVRLYETNNLSDAAASAGISVSAASRMLTKLRTTFQDELFTRYAHGLTPTSKARTLYQPICDMLQDYIRLFDETIFDPSDFSRVFHVSAVDKAIYAFLASAFQEIMRTSPRISLDFRSPSADVARDLSKGTLDLAIFPNIEEKEGFHTASLCRDGFVLVTDKSHPLAKLQTQRRLTATDLAGWRSIRVSNSIQPTDMPEEWSPAVGSIPHVSTEVAAWTPYYLSVPTILSDTELTAILPLQLGIRLAEHTDLVVIGRPESSPIFMPTLLWHDRTHLDPACQWLRALILSHCKALPDPESFPTLPC